MYSALYFRNVTPFFNFTQEVVFWQIIYDKCYEHRIELLLLLNLIYILFWRREKKDNNDISERIVALLSNGRPRKTSSIVRKLNLNMERKELKHLYLIPLKKNGILNYNNHRWST